MWGERICLEFRGGLKEGVIIFSLVSVLSIPLEVRWGVRWGVGRSHHDFIVLTHLYLCLRLKLPSSLIWSKRLADLSKTIRTRRHSRVGPKVIQLDPLRRIRSRRRVCHELILHEQLETCLKTMLVLPKPVSDARRSWGGPQRELFDENDKNWPLIETLSGSSQVKPEEPSTLKERERVRERHLPPDDNHKRPTNEKNAVPPTH